ncbi:hypothetical protein AX16_004419 [Volvariella volvacea WC 439]|nr:hypothetical protein AX16_004419 [Volvariella volvacea WC 439]
MSRVPARPITSLAGISQQTVRALTTNGYESIRDLQSLTEEILIQELKIPATDVERILAVTRKSSTPSTFSQTQSAASIVKGHTTFTTRFPSVDKLLSGGVTRGCMLELSGPPGTVKEQIARNVAVAFLEAQERVLWINFLNMTSPFSLHTEFEGSAHVPRSFEDLVMHLNIHTLADTMSLFHHLPSLITAHGKVSLLVLSSIHSPFQPSSGLSTAAKVASLQKLKQILASMMTQNNLTVVSTSQLSTKLQNADGSPATFDTGAKGIMVPQLGPSYLPAGRAYQIIIVPTSRQSGFVKLLSSPTRTPGQATVEPYELA